MHTDYIFAAAASAARATEATTARGGAASDWIVGARVGASVGAGENVGAVVGMCVQAEGDKIGGIRDADDAKNAAFLSQLVVVERMGRR